MYRGIHLAIDINSTNRSSNLVTDINMVTCFHRSPPCLQKPVLAQGGVVLSDHQGRETGTIDMTNTIEMPHPGGEDNMDYERY